MPNNTYDKHVILDIKEYINKRWNEILVDRDEEELPYNRGVRHTLTEIQVIIENYE